MLHGHVFLSLVRFLAKPFAFRLMASFEVAASYAANAAVGSQPIRPGAIGKRGRLPGVVRPA